MVNVTTAKKKAVFLFLPEELLKRYAVLHLLHISRDGGKIDYTLSAISRKEVQQHFSIFPDEAKAALLRFQPEQTAAFLKETEQRHKTGKAGIPLAAFLKQTMLRQLHRQFSDLKPFFGEIKCYHKLRKPGSSAVQMLPCTFRTEKPQLRFTVKKAESIYTIATEIGINDVYFGLDAFTRTGFFLQKENEYFLLSFNDYQTLDWLQEALKDGLEQHGFMAKVLSRLEENYKVNRNGLLEDKRVESLPLCRVLLSELNNAFLLLTPQWLYDGLVVEGPWKEEQEVSVGGERVIINRHAETEQQFLALLSSLHPAFAAQRNGYYYLSFADAQKKQWFAKAYYSLLEQDVEIAGMDMLHHFRYSPFKAETAVHIQREEGSFLYLQLTVHFGKEAVPLPALQKTLWAGQRAVVLKDGSLGVFSDEWLAEYVTIIKHGKLQKGELQVSKYLFFNNEKEARWKPCAKEEWWNQWRQWQTSPEPLFTLPATINAKLRPYQQKGFEWLALLSKIGAGACLADDMGLGKTLQTICFLAWYTEQHSSQQHLIICPTSLLYNWKQELKKFAPSLRTAVFYGPDSQRISTDANVVITSYGTFRNNSDTLLSQTYGVTVIDESHNIKNPSAQITRIVQQVSSTIRIALSGTPVVNNTFDLYSQLSFAVPGLLGSREFFKREYADAIDRQGDEKKIKLLQQLTGPFVLRRTKEQVATDLPSKTESVLWCHMTAPQEELYNEVKEQIRSNLFLEIESNGLQRSKLSVLQGLLKLRQICNHPLLLPADEHGGRVESAKTEMLMSELRHLLGRHRVLLFSQFSSMLQLLAKECDEKGISYFLLDGSTPAERRARMVKEFQENVEAPRLFLISLKAGNTGLTLTAADYVFLFDPWWNTAVEQQAIDRTHRIGQTKNVFSYKLICKNTVEEKILELQQRKRQLAEDLISAEEALVKNLSEEEVAYLFS